MSTEEPTGTSAHTDHWGDPISEERQAEMQGILDAWEAPGADHDDKKGPFDKNPGKYYGVLLTGADVSWLAERVRGKNGWVSNLHLEGAHLGEAHLEGADLSEAHLEGADLSKAHLEGAVLGRTHLEEANLLFARLERAILLQAHLERADLRGAHLDGAVLGRTHLEEADLSSARLAGAALHEAHLERARLQGVWVDSNTVLTDAMFDDKTQLGDIHWGGVGAVNLTRLDWGRVPRLGDETGLKRDAKAEDYEAAVRVYRQLAAQLRAQGMSEVADRFLYRAQVVQRRVLRKRRRFGQWLGSWFLAALAGYGYAPSRTIVWYLATVTAFAVAYYFLGSTQGHAFLPDGALVFSVTSFHGRGFFPESLNFESWVTRLAALEAVTGLFIEISFIATFTQRFFGAK
ncbi:MAG TPA: pentapeptide repeat-containing protein [Ktedonobacterales bacterium]